MRRFLAAAILSSASLLATHACRANPGDLNRCIGPDGRSIYTDHPCDEYGASVRVEGPKDPGATLGPERVTVHVRDCARTTEALRDGIQAALAAGDVNKVAAFYHWTGMGTAEADAILNRLQSIVAHPFVSVELLRSREMADVQGDRSVTPPANTEAYAIAIVQSHSQNDPGSIRTELSLTRNMGCWWVHF